MSRHEFDPVSLIAGVLFTAIGLVYLTAGDDAHLSGRAVLALGVTGLGLAGLAGAIRRLRGPARSETQTAGPAVDATAPQSWQPNSATQHPGQAASAVATDRAATDRPVSDHLADRLSEPGAERGPESSTLRFSTEPEPRAEPDAEPEPSGPVSAAGPTRPSASESAPEPDDQDGHRSEH